LGSLNSSNITYVITKLPPGPPPITATSKLFVEKVKREFLARNLSISWQDNPNLSTINEVMIK